MPPRTRRALPAKRAAEEDSLEVQELSPSTKKTKAEIRRQSLSRAKEWAADRKRKAEKDDGAAKKSKPIDDPKEAVEEVPSVTARATRRRGGRSKVVAAALAAGADDAVAVKEERVGTGTRRSSRRRTTNTDAATKAKAKATKASTTRKSRRKTVAPVVPAIEEEVEPEVSPRSCTSISLPELKVEEVEVLAELEAKEEVAVEEEAVDETEEEEIAAEEDAVDDTKEEVGTEDDAQDVNESANQGITMTAYLLQLSPAFFHALTVQWTLAFAVIMAFCYDWWIFEFGPYEDAASQQATCFTLGLWLATIAGYAIAFGPESRAGWILTGSALTMASFSAKMMAGVDTTSVPSLPIYYSFYGIDVNVPDLLVVLSLAGCVAALKQPKALSVTEQPGEVVKEASIGW